MLPSWGKFVTLSAPKLSRSLRNRAVLRPIPSQRADQIATPNDFLKAIGRSSNEKLTVDSWEDLWKLDSIQLKKKGLAVEDRKYILWSMQQYRLGHDPAKFAYPPTPPKKFRGRGPMVQKGKRIR